MTKSYPKVGDKMYAKLKNKILPCIVDDVYHDKDYDEFYITIIEKGFQTHRNRCSSADIGKWLFFNKEDVKL